MDKKTNQELSQLAAQAAAGDRAAMEAVLESIQDLVFNLSLRMLGTFPDAQDASQDILLKVMSGLPGFKGESKLTTWVFRIALNHLKDYKKHRFAQLPLSFEFYGEDIRSGREADVPDLTQGADRELLAQELKLSCTNVMLQCLDAQSRCIFILGTMFRLDSRLAGEILGISPEAYRQRLSRARKRMADFLSEYCGEYGCGACRCSRRVDYAIQNHRISPEQLDFAVAHPSATVLEVREAMEEIDGFSQQFAFCQSYASPAGLRQFIQGILQGKAFSAVSNA